MADPLSIDPTSDPNENTVSTDPYYTNGSTNTADILNGGSSPPGSFGNTGMNPASTSGGSSWLTNLLGGGGLSGNGNSIMGLAALAQAIQQYGQTGQIQNWAQTAGQMADPFAPNRAQYATQLNNLFADPSSIQNTPGYKFSLAQGNNAIAGRDNETRGVGAGSTNTDMDQYSQGLAQQTYNNTVSQLEQLSGANFNPYAAAQLQQTGMMASAGMQNQAMASLGQGIGALFGPGGNTTNNTTNNGGGPGSAVNPLGGATPGSGLSSSFIQQLLGQGGGSQGNPLPGGNTTDQTNQDNSIAGGGQMQFSSPDAGA